MARRIDVPDCADLLVLRPGDTLLVGVSSLTSEAEAGEVKARLAADLPGVHVVVVQAGQLLVYRADDVDEG